MERIITPEMITAFKVHLMEEEKSKATIEKYVRDVGTFRTYLQENQEVTKEAVIEYKHHLLEKYTRGSANTMLVSLNSFFQFIDWTQYKIRLYKIHREAFRSDERELTKSEYKRLLNTAKQKDQTWLYLIMMTICSTGIRVSELCFITVESLSPRKARVSLKGKTRTVLLPEELCRALRTYANERGVHSGSIFVTRNGKPIDRSNIWRAMKGLCEEANVDSSKVFPHNLRHLFAVTYYALQHDISHLADLLGHSDINTTRIYTRISSVQQEEQINKMGLVMLC